MNLLLSLIFTKETHNYVLLYFLHSVQEFSVQKRLLKNVITSSECKLMCSAVTCKSCGLKFETLDDTEQAAWLVD